MAAITQLLLYTVAAIAAAVLLDLIRDQAKVSAPLLAEWLRRRAITLVPLSLRERLDEEWTAVLNDTSGPLAKLWRSCGFLISSLRLTEVKDQSAELSHRSGGTDILPENLRYMVTAFQRQSAVLENFASDIAHELRNPLTSLLAAADTLALVKRDEDRLRLVQIIQHDVRRLDRLITDIFDATRLNNELACEIRGPINVADVLQDICSVVNKTLDERALQLELKVEGRSHGIAAIDGRLLFNIQGHKERLSQVIENLISNALSFSPPDGRILITCRYLLKNREVEITVEDDGIGIPTEKLEKIFERFYSVRPEHEVFSPSSGLGLTISRQIIEALGGRLWAENRTESCEGGSVPVSVLGARFVIRLPAIQ